MVPYLQHVGKFSVRISAIPAGNLTQTRYSAIFAKKFAKHIFSPLDIPKLTRRAGIAQQFPLGI